METIKKPKPMLPIDLSRERMYGAIVAHGFARETIRINRFRGSGGVRWCLSAERVFGERSKVISVEVEPGEKVLKRLFTAFLKSIVEN